MDERSDDRLVEEARQGKAEAFAELVRRHQRKVYGIIHSMTRNASDTDDLAQEVFLAAYRALPAFRGNSRFSTWLHRISVNTTLSFLKKRKREKDRAEFQEDQGNADPLSGFPDSPEERSEHQELSTRVEEAVAALPLHFRTSFLLVANQGMSHAEAARILGCSENTVSWRLHKARKLLRARLEPFLGRSGHAM
jgi:RNA polymerase sigma-70 factor (ECF subfamily)